jgi:hypothetical protein
MEEKFTDLRLKLLKKGNASPNILVQKMLEHIRDILGANRKGI